MCHRITRAISMDNRRRTKHSCQHELSLPEEHTSRRQIILRRLQSLNQRLRVRLQKFFLHSLGCCCLERCNTGVGLRTQGICHHIQLPCTCQHRSTLIIVDNKTQAPDASFSQKFQTSGNGGTHLRSFWASSGYVQLHYWHLQDMFSYIIRG